MAQNVCIVTEFRGGGFRRVTNEVASEGRRIADALGMGLVAVALGSGISAKAAELGKFGVDKVYVVDDPALEYYLAETYVPVIAEIVKKISPAAVLLPASVDGRDLGARLGARIQVTLLQDVIRWLSGMTRRSRRMAPFRGKMLRLVRMDRRGTPAPLDPSQYHAVQHCGRKQEGGHRNGRCRDPRPQVTGCEIRPRYVGQGGADRGRDNSLGRQGDEGRLELRHSGRAGGASRRGRRRSRAAVDSGCARTPTRSGRPERWSTRTSISPSASPGHQAPCGHGVFEIYRRRQQGRRRPIFSKADYGIVEDLFNFVPAFTEEVRKLKNSC